MISIEELLAVIETGEHLKIDYIRNWEDFKIEKSLSKSLGKLINAFHKDADRIYDAYSNQLKKHVDCPDMLADYNRFKNAEQFLLVDKGMVDHVIYEYRLYLLSGNLVKSLLGYERTDDDIKCKEIE